MKAIKITPANAAAIESALHAINGKATKHAYTTYTEVEAIAMDGEKALEKIGLPKAERAGARWQSVSGGKVANSYDYRRNGTGVTVERRSSAWWLVGVFSIALGNSGGREGPLNVTPAQDQSARDRFAKFYVVGK